MKQELHFCAICNKQKKTVTLQPSRSQLIFGGFPVHMEYHCQACGTKLAKNIDKMIENMIKVRNIC